MWHGIVVALFVVLLFVALIVAVVFGTGLVTPDQLEKLLP